MRQGLDIKATVFTWSITTDIRANLLSARFSKRAPAATRIHFSARCSNRRSTIRGVTDFNSSAWGMLEGRPRSNRSGIRLGAIPTLGNSQEPRRGRGFALQPQVMEQKTA